MTFTCSWYVPNTIQLSPSDDFRVVTPDVIEPRCAIGATKTGQVSALTSCQKVKIFQVFAYRYSLSFQVTMVWLVLAGGIWPSGSPPSAVL